LLSIKTFAETSHRFTGGSHPNIHTISQSSNLTSNQTDQHPNHQFHHQPTQAIHSLSYAHSITSALTNPLTICPRSLSLPSLLAFLAGSVPAPARLPDPVPVGVSACPFPVRLPACMPALRDHPFDAGSIPVSPPRCDRWPVFPSDL